MYICLCKCDRKTVVAGADLIRKKATQCFMCARNINKPYETLYNRFVHIVTKKNEKKHTCNITFKQFLKFTVIDKCHYCCAPIFWAKESRQANNKGYNLDRKNNDKGYTVNNCVVCCKRCNFGKGFVFTYKQWYKMTESFRNGELS